MHNFEIKLKIDIKKYDEITNLLEKYYIGYIIQEDTYYNTDKGKLKLRNEDGKYHMISYQRPNCKYRHSTYTIYHIDNFNSFNETILSNLDKEITVKKNRELYMYKNCRIHLDNVENLGLFFEIEVLLDQGGLEKTLYEIINMCSLQNYNPIKEGYRELILYPSDPLTKEDLDYYRNNGQLYWVLNKDIIVGNEVFKANQYIPCVYTKLNKQGKHSLLQLDLSIKDNGMKYSMWRKIVGLHYDIYVDVLLLPKNSDLVFNLNGNIIEQKTFKKSKVYVSKMYLAPFEQS